MQEKLMDQFHLGDGGDGEVIDDPENGGEGGEGGDEGGEGGKSGGEGEGGEAPATIKIGDEEFTADQVTEMQKKSGQYDAILPDYTQKSQKLAEIEKGSNKQDEPELAEYEKPGWQPKNYEDLQSALRDARKQGSEDAIKHLEGKQTAADKVRQDVDGFVEGVKKSDPDFDEEDFFKYASRHKFPVNTIEDLNAVHSSYKDLQGASSGKKPKEEDEAAERINKGGGGKGGSNVDFSDINQGPGDTSDKAQAALKRLKGNK